MMNTTTAQRIAKNMYKPRWMFSSIFYYITKKKIFRSLNSLLRAASPDLETSFILLKNISHTLKRFQDGKIKNMFFFKNPNRKKIVLSLLSE